MINKAEFDAKFLECTRAFADKQWEIAFAIISDLLRRDLSNLQKKELLAMRGSICLDMGEFAEGLKALRNALRIEGGTAYSTFGLLLACAEAERSADSPTKESQYLRQAVDCAIEDPSVCIAGCVKRLIRISYSTGKRFRLTKKLRIALINNWSYFALEGAPNFADLNATLEKLTTALDDANRIARARRTED